MTETLSPAVSSRGLDTDEATSKRLGRVRQRDTTPELAVRSALRSLGIHYRVRNRDLPGSPDIANRRRGWVIFVHGCFWHRHQGCPRATTPKRNAEFWRSKFEANQRRDRRAARQLRALGYSVLTIWECQTRDPERLQRRLERIIEAE